MLSTCFFEKNNIIYQGHRVKSFQEFAHLCSNYEIEEPLGESINNSLYLSHIDGKGKVNIILTGGGNKLTIGSNNQVNRLLKILFYGTWSMRPFKAKVTIGGKNIFNGNVTITSPVQEGRCVCIGDHNLFANGVIFNGCNDHGIFDMNTHERLNEDFDVILGNRNWICKKVEFYPKAIIQNDCVVGAHSLINKAFKENNILVVGTPGRVKRRNILWNVSCTNLKISGDMYNPLSGARPD